VFRKNEAKAIFADGQTDKIEPAMPGTNRPQDLRKNSGRQAAVPVIAMGLMDQVAEVFPARATVEAMEKLFIRIYVERWTSANRTLSHVVATF